MLARIDDVGSRAAHGESASPGCQGAAMSGRVDAFGQSTGYAEAPRGQVGREAVGSFGSGGRGVATTDDCELRQGQRIHIAADEQLWGRAGNFPEQRRVAGVSRRQQMGVGPL